MNIIALILTIVVIIFAIKYLKIWSSGYLFLVPLFLIFAGSCTSKKPAEKPVVYENYKTCTPQIVILGDKDTVILNKAYQSSGVKINNRHHENDEPDTITIIIY